MSARALNPGAVKGWLRAAPDPGVGARTRAHLEGLWREGSRGWINACEACLPRDLAALVREQPLDRIRALTGKGVHTVADLRALCDAGIVEGLPADRIEDHIVAVRASQVRLNLGRALGAVEGLLSTLADSAEVTVVPVGGLRRFEPTIGDLTLLLVGERSATVLDELAQRIERADFRARSPHALTFVHLREEITLRAVDPDHAGCALVHYTGSHVHVRQLRELATARGLRLTAGGLFGAAGARLRTPAEEDVYAALELPYIPPERRHGLDEVALAQAGRLGTPLAIEDIQGDLHLHTIWSDGRDSTEVMIWAARALGYRYMAITDHSPSAAATRVLSLNRLKAQAAEIQALRAKHPDITILHGCEVDILQDGRLDLPDAVMAELDIVLASLHEPHGHSGAGLTERYVRAMQHPCVSVVTHPTNRVPGRSQGYDLDWDLFFRTARETGTAVEVDGAPGHIDLDGHLARQAVEAGVTLAIDSDGHFAERIGRQMRIGVGTAARGGVGARHVLNTRPLSEVKAFIAAKRDRS